MIAKSEFSDVISGVVLLLEKQVEGMERAEIIDFLEALNTSDDKSLPVIIYGKKGQLLFKDIGSGTTKLIDSDSLNEVRERLSVDDPPKIAGRHTCFKHNNSCLFGYLIISCKLFIMKFFMHLCKINSCKQHCHLT